MNFIENAWATVVRSYAVWLGQIIGWIGGYMALIGSDMLSEQDKLNWHVAAQLHYIPILIAFLGIFGIGVARAVSQPSLPK
jgi:predicted permease